MPRLQLLELVGRQNRSKLLPGLLMNSMHLLLRDHRGDGGVAFQCGDLLVAIGEDGFELRRLIGGQIELLAEAGRLTLGIASMMVSLYGWGWSRDGGVRLLREEESTGESQGGE